MSQTKFSALLPLKKINFIIMAVAVVMIIVGFALMSGGGSDDGTFNAEIFSTRRIVIGPTVAFLGFLVMGAGIMWPSRRTNAEQAADADPSISETEAK